MREREPEDSNDRYSRHRELLGTNSKRYAPMIHGHEHTPRAPTGKRAPKPIFSSQEETRAIKRSTADHSASLERFRHGLLEDSAPRFCDFANIEMLLRKGPQKPLFCAKNSSAAAQKKRHENETEENPNANSREEKKQDPSSSGSSRRRAAAALL